MSRIKDRQIIAQLTEKHNHARKVLKEISELAEDYGKWMNYLLVCDEKGQVLSFSPDRLKNTFSRMEGIRRSLENIHEKAQRAVKYIEAN